jgi:hypothetical protein
MDAGLGLSGAAPGAGTSPHAPARMRDGWINRAIPDAELDGFVANFGAPDSVIR